MLSGVNVVSVNDGLMSDAVSMRRWKSASVAALDDELDDFDDELELRLDDDEDDDELDDELPDVAETFFLLSLPPRSRNAPIASTATASTPTTIHFALLEAGAPGGGPGGGPIGGGPIGGPGGAADGSAAVGGMAAVGGPDAAGGVAPAWYSGC